MNFSDFLLFFIRYGDLNDPFSVIRQAYSTDPNLRFIPGFRPDISQETARLFLLSLQSLGNRKYWIVLHSRPYNAFCLLVRIDQNNQTTIKRYFIDHFLDSSNSTFRLQSTTGTVEAKTLFSLLFDVLHLNPEDGLRIEQSFNDDFDECSIDDILSSPNNVVPQNVNSNEGDPEGRLFQLDDSNPNSSIFGNEGIFEDGCFQNENDFQPSQPIQSDALREYFEDDKDFS
jgi:hypothetical protein